jgi:hypothetical protein
MADQSSDKPSTSSTPAQTRHVPSSGLVPATFITHCLERPAQRSRKGQGRREARHGRRKKP